MDLLQNMYLVFSMLVRGKMKKWPDKLEECSKMIVKSPKIPNRSDFLKREQKCEFKFMHKKYEKILA